MHIVPPDTERSTLSLLLQIYRTVTPRQRFAFWWLCLLNCFMGFFELAVAGSISMLGVAMSAPDSLLTKFPQLALIRESLPLPDTIPQALQLLLVVLGLVCAATLLKNILLSYICWFQFHFSLEASWNIGAALFRRFLSAAHTWYMNQNSAELYTIHSWKVYTIEYISNVLVIFTQICIAVFLLTGALIASPALSFLLFITIISIVILLQKFFRKKMYDISKDIRHYELYNARVTMEALHGHTEISIYNRKNFFFVLYNKYKKQYIAKNSLRMIIPDVPIWVLEPVGMFLLLAVFLLSLINGANAAQSTGLLTLLAAVSWRLLPAANKIMGAVLNMRGKKSILEKLLAVMNSLPQPGSLAPLPIREFRHEIRLEHVRFSYPGSAGAALDDISMTIPKGGMVGIIGRSGSGKSTLINVLAGLLTPQGGLLATDGRAWSPAAERLRIGYVPQQLYLMDATLAENVAFSRWGVPPDEDRVRECCRLAAIDFLDSLPQGVRTPLGEHGSRLSGGQMQRLAIARALYDKPEILIFDEATSSLDGLTENAIQQTINSLRADMTIIMIAHRLSTVEHCDMLYWIDAGKIKMQGKPADVLSRYNERSA